MPGDKVDSLPSGKIGVPRAAPPGLARRVGMFLLQSRETSIALAAILLIIYFGSTAAAFLSPGNIANLAEYAAMTAIIAAGTGMGLLRGEVGLSPRNVYSLSPFVMQFRHQDRFPFVHSCLLGLIAAR